MSEVPDLTIDFDDVREDLNATGHNLVNSFSANYSKTSMTYI